MNDLDQDIATLRAFNRVYTLQLGLLDRHLDGSPFSLSEARILYELAHRETPTAAEIGRVLKLDRAQISRTLKRFADRGLLMTQEDPSHGRQQLLALTEEGRRVFETMNAATQGIIGTMLEDLGPLRRRQLVEAASSITGVFGQNGPRSVTLRAPQPGDLGLIVHRQMKVYGSEYGYDGGYEVLIARILADFQESHDPARDAAWIAEIDGRLMGSVFLAREDEADTCRLRLLYVEPEARGAGVGRLLVERCIEHARGLGYRRMVLWTDGQLTAAQALYKRAGFTRVKAEPARFFGQEIMSETWAMDL
jgi:DNA-binding MarR family transcriptional regulator/GNAT superfamily N-acetyltransferase